MFYTYDSAGLGDAFPVTASLSASSPIRAGAPLRFHVTGAPNEGVLVQIEKNGAVIQPTAWEGRRLDATGVVEWDIEAPEVGSYRYTFIVPQVGLTTDPQASVSFTVSAPAVSDDSGIEPDTTEDPAPSGISLPSTITIAGISLSPLVWGALLVGGYFILKGGGRAHHV